MLGGGIQRQVCARTFSVLLFDGGLLQLKRDGGINGVFFFF